VRGRAAWAASIVIVVVLILVAGIGRDCGCNAQREPRIVDLSVQFAVSKPPKENQLWTLHAFSAFSRGPDFVCWHGFANADGPLQGEWQRTRIVGFGTNGAKLNELENAVCDDCGRPAQVLPMQLNIPVVLDDSHGSGVAGPDGCAFQKEPRPLDFDNSLFSGVCGNAGRPRETDCKITQNSREKGCDDSRERNYPISLTESEKCLIQKVAGEVL
jgi:hypothetical protein